MFRSSSCPGSGTSWPARSSERMPRRPAWPGSRARAARSIAEPGTSGRTSLRSNCISTTPTIATGMVTVPITFTPYRFSAIRVRAASVQTKLEQHFVDAGERRMAGLVPAVRHRSRIGDEAGPGGQRRKLDVRVGSGDAEAQVERSRARHKTPALRRAGWLR